MNTSHERKKNANDTWITPRRILTSMPVVFDLDPCAAENQPWPCATRSFTETDNGLIQDWKKDFVWMNPPYGTKTWLWIKKLSEHNNGIALIFARTDTKTWQDYIFPKAYSIFFIKSRINFCSEAGVESDRAGAPSALVAFGWDAAITLEKCTLKGHLVRLK